ncbi:unnamed protein product [Victoria cruziana]
MQGGRGGGGGAMVAKEGGERKVTGQAPRPPEGSLRCPRCDSVNTKFCYYNNYSLAQPRHFCKTCRRYWTRGGALRNVPIGGGCRKNKRSGIRVSTVPSSSSQRGLTFADGSITQLVGGMTSPVSSSSSSLIHPSESSAMKLSHCLPSSSSMDFHVSGLPFGGPQPGAFNQYPSFRMPPPASSSPSSASTRMNSSTFGCPLASSVRDGGGAGLCNGAFSGNSSQQNMHSAVAASMESLSAMNVDLHWKLQQRRLALLLVEGQQHEEMAVRDPVIGTHHGLEQPHQQPEKQFHENPISQGNDELSSTRSINTGVTREMTNEWPFGSCSSWDDFHQYSSLP